MTANGEDVTVGACGEVGCVEQRPHTHGLPQPTGEDVTPAERVARLESEGWSLSFLDPDNPVWEKYGPGGWFVVDRQEALPGDREAWEAS